MKNCLLILTSVLLGIGHVWADGEILSFASHANETANGYSTGSSGLADTNLSIENAKWNNLDLTKQGGEQTITFSSVKDSSGTSLENITVSGTCQGRWTTGIDDSAFATMGNNYSEGPWTVKVTNVPYSCYDLILYMGLPADTDSEWKWGAVGIGDGAESNETFTYYIPDTTDSSIATSIGTTESSAWGTRAPQISGYGQDVIRICGLTNPTLSFKTTIGFKIQGALYGFQIVNTASNLEVLAPEGNLVNYSDLTWKATTTVGKIKLQNGATLTIDEEPTQISRLLIACDGTCTVNLATAEFGSLVAPIDYSGVLEKVIWGHKITPIDPIADSKFCYGGGVGSEDAPATINMNGKTIQLATGTYYLSQDTGHSNTSTIVKQSGTADVQTTRFALGTGSWALSDTAAITAGGFRLSSGGVGRTSNFKMSDTSSVTITGETNTGDNDSSSIMFGFWNGASTFTIENNATFTAEKADVLVGFTGNNQTINVNGGTFKARGIKTAKSASGTNILNLNGGELKLGETGITAYDSSRTLAVNVKGDAKITSTSASGMSITHAITVDEDKTLTLDASTGKITLSGTLKNNGALHIADNSSVTVSGTVEIAGNLSLGAGTSANIGTWHPTLTALGENTTLTLSADANAFSVRLPIANSITTVPSGFTVRVTEWGDSITSDLTIEDKHLVISKPIAKRVWKPTAATDGILNWSDDWSGEETATVAVLDLSEITTDATLAIPANAAFTATEIKGGSSKITITFESEASLGALTILGDVGFTSVGFTTMMISDDSTVTFAPGSDLTVADEISGDGRVVIQSGAVTFSAPNTYIGGTTIENGATLALAHKNSLEGKAFQVEKGGILEYCLPNSTQSFSDLDDIQGDGTFKISAPTNPIARHYVTMESTTAMFDSSLTFVNDAGSAVAGGSVDGGVMLNHGTWQGKTFAIHNLSGSGDFRGDADAHTTPTKVSITQNQNTTYNGTFWADSESSNRFFDVTVLGEENATDKTLTLAGGNPTDANGNARGNGTRGTLTVDTTGSVKLAGKWNGPVVVNGELIAGGTDDDANSGQISGALTFNADAVLDVSAGALTTASTVTVGGTLTVKLSALPSAPQKILSATGTKILNQTAVHVKVGETTYAGWTLMSKDDGIYLRRQGFMLMVK